MNQIQIMGRLTRDPELRATQSGISVATFSLAVQRPYAKRDGDGNFPVDFINVTAWRHTGDFASKYFAKGQRAAVTGYLQTGSYTDNEGIKRYKSEVIAQHIFFADSRKELPADPPAFADNLVEIDDDGALPL